MSKLVDEFTFGTTNGAEIVEDLASMARARVEEGMHMTAETLYAAIALINTLDSAVESLEKS